MVTPPVFSVIKNNAAAYSALWWAGGNQLKLYEFGMAPEGVQDPYCVWQVIGGSPEIYLGEAPDIDRFTVQFDIYGTTSASVRDVAQKIRDAIEHRYPVTSWLGGGIDPETKRYRLTFQSDWWINR